GIVQSGVISMGGDEVTRDIAYAFDTSLEEAKRLKEKYGVAKSSTLKEEKLIDFTQAANKEEHQLSSLQLSEVIEEAYREILLALKNQLKHHNLDTIIKSGFVLCGGGAQVISCEELVRDFFTRRAKIGTIPDSRIFGLDNILTDFRYTGSIGLLLHEDDFGKDFDVISNGNNGVIGKLKEWTVKNF
ncbi:MAG: cell division FtsA domain-containing protein, partial [Candidatus Thioglobus sp.]|nr:cell division FtsA domain-containing protein [Candidatus Thioglobus sp.]